MTAKDDKRAERRRQMAAADQIQRIYELIGQLGLKAARAEYAEVFGRSHDDREIANDNPFSESHFKTMKYQPQFPQRFGCIQDAKAFCRGFFDWYNQEHHHAGIGLMTPDQVHYGQADAIHAARQNTLDGAFNRNPERFVRKEPEPPAKPIAAWINPPPKTLNIQA
jgi:putative transposase